MGTRQHELPDGAVGMKLLLGLPALLLAFAAVFVVVLSARPAPVMASLDQAACIGTVNYHLDAEAQSNAAIVIATTAQMGLSQRAAVIALGTALQESGLHNHNYGDAAGPDSRGIFQQRSGWGPLAIRLDPAGATRLFVASLTKVPAWDALPLGVVALAVQHFQPQLIGFYQAHEAEAQAILASYTSSCANNAAAVSGAGQPGNPLACHPTVTQGFGPSVLLVEPAAHGFPHFHGGIDLACLAGTVVRVIEYGGTAHVTMSNTGYGNHVDVEIQAPTGHFWARYAHLAAVAVNDRQTVKPGDLLGWEGSTGASSGPHLHFGLYLNGLSENDTVNPSSSLAL
jgi:murein DD-endopeptidase MepM/ murein hydrolase activator NlpD